MGSFSRAPSFVFTYPSAPELTISFAFALAVVFTFNDPATAAVSKGVQGGTATIAAAGTTASVTLATAVDPARSFLVFGVAEAENQPQFGQVTGRLSGPTTVDFVRNGAGAAIAIKWYVAEFTSGVSVQRGTTPVPNDTPVNVALTSVNTAKAFPIVTVLSGGASFDRNDYVQAKITGATTLRLSHGDTGSSATVDWQVVEYQDATVQSGDVTFNPTDLTLTATPATPIDPARSWLMFSFECRAIPIGGCGSVTNIGTRSYRGVVTNGTTLTFDRKNAGLTGPPAETYNLTWYLVEFTDGTSVQSASEPFGAADTQRDVALAAPAPPGSSLAAASGFMRGGRTPYAADDVPGVAWFTLDLTSSTNLRLTRGSTNAPGPGPAAGADVGWFVVSFSGGSCCQLLTTATASTVTVTGPAQFEMRFNTAAGGGIDLFYDLAEDPARATDLAGGDAAHRNLFIDEIVDPGLNYYFSADGVRPRLELLEATPTRVRVRQGAFFGNGTGNLPDVFATGDYSIYGSGRMALSWRRWKTPSATVNYNTEELELVTRYGAPPIDNWLSYHDGGPLSGVGPPDSTFLLVKSDAAGARTDFLQIMNGDWAVDNQSVGGDTGGGSWQTLWRDNNTGTIVDTTFNFLTYFKPTTFLDNTDSAVTSRSADYRVPDSLSVTVGAPWLDASENTGGGDDFNESEAAYVLTFDPFLGLTFDMDGTVANPRYSPLFKVRQWRSLSPVPQVTLEAVTLQKNVGYKADVKPISRAHSAERLFWHSTLESLAALDTSPDVGSAGAISGTVNFVPARYGNGAEVVGTSSYFNFPTAGNFDPAIGAIEFWYQPDYASDDGSSYTLGGYNFNGANYWLFEKDNFNNLRFRIVTVSNSSEIVAPSGSYGWRANDWVHLRFEWNDTLAVATQLKIFVNGVEPNPGGGTGADYLAASNVSANFQIGRRSPQGGSPGIYDEVMVYAVSSTTPKALAMGGLSASASEYLASTTNDFQLPFKTVNGTRQGEYLYLGSDSKFRGLNVTLQTPGVGAVNLKWEFWNGTSWADLECCSGFIDETNHLTKQGTIYWTGDPFNWSVYSVNGGPDLYYVRAYLASGTYTTPPVESLIKTDILLFQYCGDIVDPAQTFVFAVPPTTAVELLSFEGRGLNGAVELTWETASELQNLGFHLYRALSESGPYERITSSPILGLGSSPHGASYRYLDSSLVNGATYFYELEDIEATGKTKRHGPVSAVPQQDAPLPKEGASGGSLVYGDPSRVSFVELSRSSRSLVLELTTSGFEARLDESGSVGLSIPGFVELSEPGAPEIPVKRSWVEVPPGRMRLASVRAEEVEVFSSLRPSAVGAPELVASRTGTVRASRMRGREGAAFQGAGFYPEEWARLVEVGYQGDAKKALVELSPLRWDRTRGELVLARRLSVRLSFAAAEAGNHQESRSHARTGGFHRLVALEKGLYGARFEEVMGRGRRGVSTSKLSLSRGGEAVVFHVEPETGVYGPGSVLYFLSEGARENPYGNEAVYELSVGVEGERMELASAAPGGSPLGFYWGRVEREENRYYQAGLLEAPDLWFWDLLMAPGRKSFSFEVSELQATSESARLELRIQGVSDSEANPDHHVRVSVNGAVVGETELDGKESSSVNVQVPSGILREGENELELENVSDTLAPYSMVMLDRFAVSYPRRLTAEGGQLRGQFSKSGEVTVEGLEGNPFVVDVTGRPRWIRATGMTFSVESGREYLVVGAEAVRTPSLRTPPSSRLKNTRLQADYLVIGRQELLGEAEPLLELRRSQGLRSQSVSLSQVYSEFGYGESRPEAVRAFLSYAYHHWKKPSPRYVLLLGDATYDFKDYLGTGVKNQVPALAVKTSYLWTASDAAYASVNGEDELPALAIGRLPAKNALEARGMVAKVLEYERSGSLSGASILVADNSDAAGDFEANAEEIAESLLASRAVRKIYVGRLGGAATSEIVAALDDGASHLSYIGHGGIHLWAQENIFNTGDVAALQGQSQQPLVLTLNCLNGYFHFPYFDSLSEALVKAEGKGAIAAFSPSGLSLDGPAHLFHKAILSEVLSGGHPRLGDAVLAAQAAYAETGAFSELLRIYHLFGDPALRIR